MKYLLITLLLATVTLSIAEPATDANAAGQEQAEQIQASELLRAMGGHYFRIRMPAEVPAGSTACLVHRLPDGSVKELASLPGIEPNQMLTLVFIQKDQKRPYFSLSHAGVSVSNEIDVNTQFARYSPSNKIYSSGDSFIEFRHIGRFDEDGKAATTTSNLFVQLQHKEEGEQGGADQPATAPESKLEGKDKPNPESKVAPR